MIRHTLSAGVITALDQDTGLSPAEMLMKVDLALYEAKSSGRNRTIVHA
jgi:PleD family two-component response regulator